MSRSAAAYFKQPHFWVALLWATAMGVGIALLRWGLGELELRARGQMMTLLPKSDLDADQRDAIRAKLTGERGVASAEWIAPEEQTRALTQKYSDKGWEGMFPQEASWLPWVLQIRMLDPLQWQDTADFLQRRNQEGSWEAIVWDRERIGQLAALVQRFQFAGGLTLLVVLIAGGIALAVLPPLEPFNLRQAVFGGGTIGALVPALIICAFTSRYSADVFTAAATGFILAGAIAPMLRKKRSQSLSVSVGADPGERL